MPDHPARPRHRHHQHRTTLLSGRDASPRDEWPRPGHGTRSRSAKAMGGSRSETRSCDRPDPTALPTPERSTRDRTLPTQVGEPGGAARAREESVPRTQSIPAHARSSHQPDGLDTGVETRCRKPLAGSLRRRLLPPFFTTPGSRSSDQRHATPRRIIKPPLYM